MGFAEGMPTILSDRILVVAGEHLHSTGRSGVVDRWAATRKGIAVELGCAESVYHQFFLLVV